jgi:hypothetical protein
MSTAKREKENGFLIKGDQGSKGVSTWSNGGMENGKN